MDLYGVNEVEIMGDKLHININYGGGCEQHDFQIISSINQINDDGEQVDVLFLSHDANNDPCFAEVLEHQLCFDISNTINGGLVYFSTPDSLYELN